MSDPTGGGDLLAKIVIQRQGLIDGGLGLCKCLCVGPQPRFAEQQPTIRKAGPGGRKSGRLAHRFSEIANGFPKAVLGPLVPEIASLQIGVPRLGRHVRLAAEL